ncbi:hypothetical protein KZI27_10535 [Curtobacterium sp. TC1]|uniref:hypothetical protein n=1 Tax=Curtobacterium sp. TC1 TaxID=2862880 RepID=UPI001C9A7A77|nr:hypothetical protein [Curtobacterium sp. TC1]QZQ53806.1 hypothetical protein KZI27_10535 [Curtobacterium sp. TC1]
MSEPSLPPDIAEMPSDKALLADIGRVAWAAARLHAAVRDVINSHVGAASDAPSKKTLGGAIADLEKLATAAGRADQVDWVVNTGRPASRKRNAVVHAVTYMANDGKQALGTVDHSVPRRFLAPELQDVTRALVDASRALPR